MKKMDDRPIKVLLIEDDPEYTHLMQAMVTAVWDTRLDLECADQLSTGLERLAEGDIDAVLLDLLLPDSRGFDTFAKVHAQAPDVPIIVLTCLDDEALAVEMVRDGAHDYLVKGQEDEHLLMRAIRYASERKRAEEVLRQRNRELALLNRAGHALSSSLDPDRVLITLLEEVRRLMDVTACSVWLIDAETDELVCRHATGPRSEIVRGWRLPQSEGLVGWTARNRESLVVPDARADERYFRGVDEQTGLVLRSILSTPLWVKQRVIGVLQVVDTEFGRFGTTDLRLLEPLAASAAIAIENARLYEAEHAAREQLRDLASYLQTAREEERTYIAREIHDELGQALTALKMDLSWLTKRLPVDEPGLAKKAGTMTDLIDATIQTVRRVATKLRPGLLDDLGLVAALEWQAQEFAERTGIDCELHLGDEDAPLDRDLATVIFRIFQETLTNVARHAEATELHVELQDRADELVLTVQDNGKSITQAHVSDPKSLGLIGMRERARAWGGDVTFQGVPGQGTTVTMRIPRKTERGEGNDQSACG